ncbi:hypothetical protein PTE30175_04810 [Pandoraea terrae]|uniref:Uncharacterized protein n=1 Tax=Pandoraea terrae TaxID=1537710 RepID=A0A5E4Z1M4_9BURK|nr:hypothetical protein PTE30175_04810 [Pandoraea terrae]
MSSDATSLRSLIDKWVASTPASPIRLTRLTYAKRRSVRCVRAESIRASGSLAIFFFRHDDGAWCVFPPMSERPTMRALMKVQ